jgi:hypothetical protein
MAIEIRRVGDLYEARITSPNNAAPWSTYAPVEEDVLIEALRDLGCHQTDIGDAFQTADPGWVDRVSA